MRAQPVCASAFRLGTRTYAPTDAPRRRTRVHGCARECTNVRAHSRAPVHTCARGSCPCTPVHALHTPVHTRAHLRVHLPHRCARYRANRCAHLFSDTPFLGICSSVGGYAQVLHKRNTLRPSLEKGRDFLILFCTFAF